MFRKIHISRQVKDERRPTQRQRDEDEYFLLTNNMFLKIHSFQGEDEHVHDREPELLADDSNTNSDHNCDEVYDNFMFKSQFLTKIRL